MKLNWLYIAWRNLGLKKLQTSLSLVLLAFGVGLVSLLMLSEKQLSATFNRNIEDIDLVLGAKGSPLQLILANVYHVDAPTGNIRLADAEKVMRHPYIAEGIPLAYGDNYRGFRIVGSTEAYTAHYEASWATGRAFESSFEVVVGAQVAERTGLNVGDEFFSAHGLQDETDVHTDKVFTVVGILEPNGTVLDQLLLRTDDHFKTGFECPPRGPRSFVMRSVRFRAADNAKSAVVVSVCQRDAFGDVWMAHDLFRIGQSDVTGRGIDVVDVGQDQLKRAAFGSQHQINVFNVAVEGRAQLLFREHQQAHQSHTECQQHKAQRGL